MPFIITSNKHDTNYYLFDFQDEFISEDYLTEVIWTENPSTALMFAESEEATFFANESLHKREQWDVVPYSVPLNIAANFRWE